MHSTSISGTAPPRLMAIDGRLLISAAHHKLDQVLQALVMSVNRQPRLRNQMRGSDKIAHSMICFTRACIEEARSWHSRFRAVHWPFVSF